MTRADSSLAFAAPLAALLLAGCTCGHVQGSRGDVSGHLAYQFGDVSEVLDVGATQYSFGTMDDDGNLTAVVVDSSAPTEIQIRVALPSAEPGMREVDVDVCACASTIDQGVSDPHAGVPLPGCDAGSACETARGVMISRVGDIDCGDDACVGHGAATLTLVDGGLGVRGTLDVHGELTSEPSCYVPGLFPF